MTKKGKNKSDLTVIVRTVSERTTDTCIQLLSNVIPHDNIFVISEIPFSKAVRKSFVVGIENKKKWTLVIDADVLIRESFINEMLDFAEQQPDNTFVIQGLVHDKIFDVLRPAGNHLFRTKYLNAAIESIPREGTTLRPNQKQSIIWLPKDSYSFKTILLLAFMIMNKTI